MLKRCQFANGVVAYVSPLLQNIGVPHAFSTRIGGASPAPFDSLNLGNPNGCAIQDLRERIRGNYRLLLEAAGCCGRELLWLHQVHGGQVVRVTPGQPHNQDAKADALVGDDPSRVLSVRIADCTPVLLSTSDGKTVAAIHAGWRGVIAGAATNALREICQITDADPSSIIAAIGPSIGFDAFEVGPEVLDEFQQLFGSTAAIRRDANGKGRVDLREALRRQLLACGMNESQIDLTDRCTHRDASEFFSHRRDNGVTGRMAAVISPVA